MGAKLSRRKSDGATGTDGVAAEAAAQQKPATESDEQKPAEAELESKPTEQTPGVDSSPSEPAPRALEAITQAVEETVSSVSEQIVAPVEVEDVVNEDVAAVEPMMAAISIKDEPVAPPPESPSEPLDSSIPNPPEDAVPQSDESSPLEPLLPEPIPTATVEDVIPVTADNEAVQAEIDAQESFECTEMGMTQDEAAPEDQLSNVEL